MISEAEDKMFRAARLSIDQGCSQTEIAKELGINQSQVSRLLIKAKEKGLIVEKVITPFKPDLARKIMNKFSHLQECHVIGYKGDKSEESQSLLIEELGRVGANHFFRNVKSNSNVGISCGATLGKMVEHIEEGNIKGLNVYSLSIWCKSETYQYTPSSLVTTIVNKCPQSRGFSLQLPELNNLEEKKGIEKNVEKMLHEANEKVNTIYIGLGHVSLEAINAAGKNEIQNPTLGFCKMLSELNIKTAVIRNMAGECCLWPYGVNGEIFDENMLNDLNLKTFHFKLEHLQKKVEEKKVTICAVSGGSRKHQSVLAGLKARIFNHLITDAGCAEYICSPVYS